MSDQSRTLHKGADQRPRPGRRTSLAVVGVIAAITLTACAGDPAPPEHRFDVSPYVHQGHVVDCGTFNTQADAQAVLRADTLDPNGLDRDGDGIACPDLPEPKDEKPVHRDFMTDVDGAPIIDPIKPPPT
ncbi:MULTISPECIES: excalibur calcium-binding domain-containing protein [unclassified Streptomyces]|uniref:excalibur calcium-binding domain-containing protein n=1 Tax=unclassified Streptomyces TaxID=2593676 RepID=UPI00099DF9ED|nr:MULTISPECIES: excalibur calcium-binding domain-containing protein [unclassified Streptomyces]